VQDKVDGLVVKTNPLLCSAYSPEPFVARGFVYVKRMAGASVATLEQSLSYNTCMPRKQPPSHTAEEFDLDVLTSDTDMFRWFLLCYLFGKPIRAETAVETWRLFIAKKFDTPVAIVSTSEHELVSLLHRGGYTRYQHVTARGLQLCMERLVRLYDGSLLLMLDSSADEEEFAKRLKELHGVGPKVAEICTRATEEYFARRVE
jgi:endonuclease III